jgi:endonuclease/exonuclease/phosphatase family metal-dependent hydrolase
MRGSQSLMFKIDASSPRVSVKIAEEHSPFQNARHTILQRLALYRSVLGLLSFASVVLSACTAAAQLRVVSYNTLKRPSTSSQISNWNVVLQAIGNESRNGIVQRIGIMALQEVDQQTSGQNAKNIASQLNTLYGVTSYQSAIAGSGDGFNLQAFVYDSSQVQLLSTSNPDIGTRPAFRGRFRPVGYSSAAAEFYVYSAHLKAFSDEQATRASEATLLRNNGNFLGQGANIIYAGDFNLTGGASEAAYNTMLGPGNGQAIDPENGDFTTLTKRTYSSTSATSRLDFQFITNELADDEGLDLIDGSYRVFGRVPNGSGVITSPSQLTSASDHLPVVADYQLPAMMQADLASVPISLMQGANYLLDLSVSNVAPVVSALGADELDYTLSVIGGFGSLLGESTGIDAALGSANLHQIALDTSTPGIRSGTIQITSSSPGVANGFKTLNVMFEVLAAALAGDFNNDGTIDAADYSVWRDAFQAEGVTLLNDPTPESVDESDYAFWRDHFGESLGGGGTAALATVPEPANLSMIAVLFAGMFMRRARGRKQHG